MDMYEDASIVPVVEPRSIHVTFGVETDSDDWTWLALLRDAAVAVGIERAAEQLEAAQWHEEALREALPLALCRPGGRFDAASPLGIQWLDHARRLLKAHLPEGTESKRMRAALDEALRTRQDLVERKRQQIVEFMALSPPSLQAQVESITGHDAVPQSHGHQSSGDAETYSTPPTDNDLKTSASYRRKKKKRRVRA